MAGRAVAIEADAAVAETALDWLAGQLRQSDWNTLDAAEQAGLAIPATPADAEQAWRILQNERAQLVARLERIAAIKQEIANRLDQLFVRKTHPARQLTQL